ncbi:hypothetical protein EZS27_023361 [termite gut metagenome]|uniref:N-acetyltransferase domain-containing protein n=1 Tax=termite gut metagenome TaxID=433724 RepID=A0A5J4R250_9ZZZZ
MIARLRFQQERIGHGSDILQYIREMAMKYGYKYIGLESTNEKSTVFGLKHGFRNHKGMKGYYIFLLKEIKREL